MGVGVAQKITHPCQPSPIPLSGRPAHRPFRGLLGVHSRCGLHTRTVTVCRDRYPKASDTSSPPCLLRSLPAGAVAGWGLHPLEKRRLVTAHVVSGHSFPSSPGEVCKKPAPRVLGEGEFLCRRVEALPGITTTHPHCSSGQASSIQPWGYVSTVILAGTPSDCSCPALFQLLDSPAG